MPDACIDCRKRTTSKFLGLVCWACYDIRMERDGTPWREV